MEKYICWIVYGFIIVHHISVLLDVHDNIQKFDANIRKSDRHLGETPSEMPHKRLSDTRAQMCLFVANADIIDIAFSCLEKLVCNVSHAHWPEYKEHHCEIPAHCDTHQETIQQDKKKTTAAG